MRESQDEAKEHRATESALPDAPTCHDLSRDLAGSIKGLPKDIATNPKFMEDFGQPPQTRY